MLRGAVLFAIISVIFYVIMEYRIWLDVDRVLYSKSPGRCTTLLTDGGSEDMVELDDDTILISSGLNAIGNPGRIYVLKSKNGSLEEALVENTVNNENPLLGPHGITIWKDPTTGTPYLYVVSHGVTDERVVVFEVIKSRRVTLKYIKTIRDESFGGFMNDLVVIGRDKFYITQSVRWRSLNTWIFEIGLALPTGRVVYYDGQKGRPVVTGLRMANGIALSNDKRTLYVAELGRRTIYAFKPLANGDLETIWVTNIGAGPDNINVDSATGDLWVGTCPLMITAIDVPRAFGYLPAGQVLRIRLTNNKVADIEEIYSNNGSDVTGSSVAMYKNKKLFIGTVLSQLVMCDVNYLKP